MISIQEWRGQTSRQRGNITSPRAARLVAKVRKLDPHLANALLDPANLQENGQPRLTAIAEQLGRKVSEVREDLATLRALVEV